MQLAVSETKGDRLDSWKAIAEYLGVEVRSVQRWEKERGLPAHRVPGDRRGRVFAYSSDLDAWLNSGTQADIAAQAEKSERRLATEVGTHSIEPNAGFRVPPTKSKFLAAAIVLSMALAFAGYLGFFRESSAARANTGREMLAVLPFQNLSGDSSQEYFADGLTEEMITDLGRLNPKALGVIARTSAMKYKQSHQDIAQIGRELGVHYILEGSVRREGQTARISAQLIRVSDQTHVWAQNFERPTSDILGVEQEVAQAITEKIQVRLGSEGRARLALTNPTNPDAHDAYLTGLYYWNRRSAADLKQAIHYLVQATEEDGSYAPSFAALAQCYTLVGLAAEPQENRARARAAALKAIELDDTSAEAHTALGGVKSFYDYDWEGARREFARAIALNPNYALAHHWYANLYLDPQKHYTEAIAEMRVAQTLDPNNSILLCDLGQAYYFAGQYDKALEIYQRVETMDAEFVPVHWYLADAYRELGKFPEEMMENAAVLNDSDDSVRLPFKRGQWEQKMVGEYERSGRSGQLLAVLSYFHQTEHPSERIPAVVMEAYLGLGEGDQAMEWLNRSYASRDPHLLYLAADPLYNPLRADYRFQKLVSRMGLAAH